MSVFMSHRINLSIVKFILLSCPFLLITLISMKAESEAQIKFRCTEYNFGDVYEDEGPIEYEYIFRNIGKRKLFIQDIKTTCGCSNATCSREEFAPGESGVIKLSMSILGRSNKIEEKILVYTNDPKQQKILLSVEGKIKHAVTIIPNKLSFGLIYPDKVETKELKITLEESQNQYQITQVSSNIPSLKITRRSSENVEQTNNEEYVYNISVTGKKQTAFIQGEINVRTTHPKKRYVKIPIVIEHTGALIVSPRCVSLGRIRPNQKIARSINISAIDGSALELSDISLKGPWRLINHHISRKTKDSSIWLCLEIECNPYLYEKFLKGELVLTTSSTKDSILKIPVTALKRRGYFSLQTKGSENGT